MEDFNYSNSEITQEIYSAMNSTRFLGVSVGTSIHSYARQKEHNEH